MSDQERQDELNRMDSTGDYLPIEPVQLDTGLAFGAKTIAEETQRMTEALQPDIEALPEDVQALLDEWEPNGSNDWQIAMWEACNKAVRIQQATITSLMKQIEKVENENQIRKAAYEEAAQELGKAMGYLWYKDDQKTFPGATEADGVFYDIPETPIDQAPGFITSLTKQVKRLRSEVELVLEMSNDVSSVARKLLRAALREDK